MSKKNKNKDKELKKEKKVRAPKTKEYSLNVDFRISAFCGELIRRLHLEYPSKERSGIARIEKRKGYYIMSDIKFGKQTNTGGNTEISKEGLNDILESVISENPRALGEYNCWIHSHHSMGVFWSSTDEAQKKSFNDGNTKFQWSVVTAYNANSVVYKCALNVFKPVNVEFNVPVNAEKFDMKEYLAEKGANFEAFEKTKKGLEIEYNKKREEAMIENPINMDDVKDLLSIFNLDDVDDNVEYCKLLLSETKENKKNDALNHINFEYNLKKDEITKFFCGMEFENKIQQLRDSIIKPVYATNYSEGSRFPFENMSGVRHYEEGSQMIQTPLGLKERTAHDDFDEDEYYDREMKCWRKRPKNNRNLDDDVMRDF